jgi:hypothetical protein
MPGSEFLQLARELDRNAASYDLQPLPRFATAVAARDAEKKATDAIALLDAIDTHLARRAAAVASIQP